MTAAFQIARRDLFALVKPATVSGLGLVCFFLSSSGPTRAACSCPKLLRCLLDAVPLAETRLGCEALAKGCSCDSPVFTQGKLGNSVIIVFLMEVA